MGIDGDKADLANRSMARACQKHRHNPEVTFSQKPLGFCAQAAKWIVLNNVSVSGLQYCVRLRLLGSAPTHCERSLFLPLHGRYPSRVRCQLVSTDPLAACGLVVTIIPDRRAATERVPPQNR